MTEWMGEQEGDDRTALQVVPPSCADDHSVNRLGAHAG